MNASTSKFLALALLGACKGADAPASKSDATASAEAEPARAEVAQAQVAPASGPDEKAQAEPEGPPPIDPVRATTASSVKGKAASHLGFSPDKLTGWFSIDGRAIVPSWAAQTDADPADVRDDDLRTAWTCTGSAEKPCALGLSFDAPAKVHAVRLYGAAGPDYLTYRGHPRIAGVRIHTDAGWVEAGVKDGATHGYVVFDEPIETRTIAVEVSALHAGRKSETVHLAELEVLGTTGPKRPPLDLDPAASAVVFETDAWANKGDRHTIRLAFLEVARPDGTLQRLLRGTSLLGRRGDRFLLIEKLHGSRCDEHDGSYILLDQHTRMLYPLGTMGAVPGRVLRHDGGEGFAVRAPEQSTGPFRAVVLDDGGVKIKYSPKQDDRAAKAQRDWGFASEALVSRGGGARMSGPPTGCETVEDAGDAFEPESFSPAQIVSCDLDDGHKAFVATDGACARQWAIAVVNGEGEVLHRQAAKEADGRGLWLSRFDGAGLVVEGSRGEGASADLFAVGPDGITLLAKGATLALRIPATCDPCDDRFAVERDGDGGIAAATPREPEADQASPEASDALPSVDDDEADELDDED